MSWVEDIPKEHLEWIKYRFDEVYGEYRLDEIPYGLAAEIATILHKYGDEAIEDLKRVIHCTIQGIRTHKPMKLFRRVDNSESMLWHCRAAISAYRVATRMAILSTKGSKILEALTAKDPYFDAESILSAATSADKETRFCSDDD